ncbi:MAG TPA: cysteine--tRNA ligase [Verrucomicrobia bacterium]|nr:cysteine--tRNA ligase [Verrucomicrobiota bacterium]
MRVYNTLSRQMEPVVPIEGRRVRLYTCGPTVYNAAHIGNFRTYVFEDLLRRYLKYSGFEVTQVMNLTDVDDKTIRGSRQAGVSLDAYTAPFKRMFFEDLKLLNIEPAEHYPAATDHIAEVITLIERLMARGLAYTSDDGSVYFSIARFPGYGKLGHIDMAGLRAGARVAQDEYEKENVADFALWKAWDADDGDVAWDSPWGRGRPGWHVECSAMSMRYLGESFDIHTGGVDNIFPHHDDEIAQSEGATGKPFVKTWMHSAHLIVDGKKMSKSLGNFHTLRDVMARGYNGREVRYVLLAAHYRQSLNFTFEAVEAARSSLARIDAFMDRLKQAPAAGSSLPDWALQAETVFKTSLDEDLNISEALAGIFEMVHAGNRDLDAGRIVWSASQVLALLARFDTVLGVLTPPALAIPEAVQVMLTARAAARAAKQWTESDRLRDAMQAAGWDVRDTPEGQKLTKR